MVFNQRNVNEDGDRGVDLTILVGGDLAVEPLQLRHRDLPVSGRIADLEKEQARRRLHAIAGEEVVAEAVVPAGRRLDMPLEPVADPAADRLEREGALALLDRVVVISEAERPGDGKIVHDLEPLPLDLSEGIVVDEVAGVDDEVGLLGRDHPVDHGGGAIGGRPGIEVGVGDLEEPQGAIPPRREADVVVIALRSVDEEIPEPLPPLIGTGRGVKGPDGKRPREGEPGERGADKKSTASHVNVLKKNPTARFQFPGRDGHRDRHRSATSSHRVTMTPWVASAAPAVAPRPRTNTEGLRIFRRRAEWVNAGAGHSAPRTKKPPLRA